MICDDCRKKIREGATRHDEIVHCPNPGCIFYAPWVVGET